MSKRTYVPALTVVLLLGFGGVSFGGVRVGGSGGAGVGYWEHSSSGCGTTLNRSRAFQQVPNGELHAVADLGESGVRLGAAGGFRLQQTLSEAEEYTADDGDWILTGSTSRTTQHRLLWSGLRVGYSAHFIELDAMLGFGVRDLLSAQGDVLAFPQTQSLTGVGTLSLSLGAVGVAAFHMRARIWGQVSSPELGVVFALRVLGTDTLPAIWAGADFGADPHEPSLAFTAGLAAPRRWRVQPFVEGRVGGPRRFGFTLGIDVVIGPQLQTPRRPEKREDERDEDLEERWANPDEPWHPHPRWDPLVFDADDGTRLRYLLLYPDKFEFERSYPAAAVLPPGDQGRTMAEAAVKPWDEDFQAGWLVVVPIAPRGELFSGSGAAHVAELMEHIAETHRIEDDRYSVFGISEGGRSAFSVAMEYPALVRSITVVPGVPDSAVMEQIEQLAAIPVTLVVGTDDPEWKRASERSVVAMRAAHLDVELIVLKGAGHYAFQDLPWSALKRWLER